MSPPETPLRLNGRDLGPHAIMAVVNRTPDSFFDKGATYGFGAALAAVDRAVAEGADIVDIGGVKAGPGEDVGVAEELRRVVGLVAAVRERHPRVVISVDTWRAEVGEAVAEAGADLLNDTWGGPDPRLAEAAAAHGIGLVCSHAGALAPAPARTASATPTSSPTSSPMSRPRPSARRPSAYAGTRSSSTRPTTSARTPASPWRSPAASASSPAPAGRCWSRSPTRTSSARR